MDVLYNSGHMFECNLCTPNVPVNIYDKFGELRLCSYGDYVASTLERSKYKSEQSTIYPIGFTSQRRFPSYKFPHTTTTITCEISCVDENYLDLPTTQQHGNKDVFLFTVTFEDDKDHPIQVLNSMRYISAKIREKYNGPKSIPSARKIFGICLAYVQYLIVLHVPQADDVCPMTSDELLQLIDCDDVHAFRPHCKTPTPDYMLDAHNQYSCGGEGDTLMPNNEETRNLCSWFDPQLELFNF